MGCILDWNVRDFFHLLSFCYSPFGVFVMPEILPSGRCCYNSFDMVSWWVSQWVK